VARLDAMSSIEEPLVLTMGDQRVLWANEAASQMFEIDGDRLLGLGMRELLALPPQAVVEACRSVTARGHVTGNVDIVTGRGRTVPSRFRAFALGENNLHLVAFGAPGPPARQAGRNGSDRLPMSAEIAAAIGHEIRTPLATALVYMTILKREIDAGFRRGPVRSALATARQEISRIDRLVTRVTEMEGLGFPIMRPRLVDVGQVVSRSVRRAVGGGSARLVRLEIGPGDLTDWWDEGAVEEIVQNLLSNALKFGEGRQIDVAVERAQERARLSVRDRGIGLAVSQQARVFERRVRAPLARSPGLGLGLWFVRTLAEAHRGTVAVRSRPGDGATFTVTLRPLDKS
jgi:signal transduction histidine kinase